jgi:hypothetical protein
MSLHNPERKVERCEECGEETTTTCPTCLTPIRGVYLGGAVSIGYDLPAFCYKCGNPFPWTERNQQAAFDLYADTVQNEAEREAFKRDLEAVVKNTPQSVVSASRLKRAAGKLTGGLGKVVIDIVVRMASDEARKILHSGG